MAGIKKEDFSNENKYQGRKGLFMTKRIGLILITFGKLEQLFNLSEGHIITDIIYGDTERTRNSFLVKVSGPDMPISKEGRELMIIPLYDLGQ